MLLRGFQEEHLQKLRFSRSRYALNIVL